LNVDSGTVRPRAEAKQTYDTAVHQGRQAALLEKDLNDSFVVHIGNLKPNEWYATPRVRASTR
jgi:Ca-activated chloride channel family protein